MATDSHLPSISVVIVAWNSREQLARTIPPLLAELGDDDELVVVDNASADDSAALVAELAPSATVIGMQENVGFAAGANAGAAAASGELLVLLNPDAVPRPGFGAAIRGPLSDGRGWAAWMALVTAERGAVVNSLGGVLHFTGIAWAGGAGEPVPPDLAAGEVPFLSGACLAIPRAGWRQLGGFSDRYFLYHEDVDVSLRLRLQGGRIGIEPAAVVDHDYEFGGAAAKYRHLERNRWATVLRDYPAPLLALLDAGAAGDRAGADRDLDPRRLGQAEVGRELRRPAGAWPDPAGTQGDPARAHDQRGRVRLLPHARPRLRLSGASGRARAPALGPARLLGAGAPAAAMSTPTRLERAGDVAM